MQTGRAAVETPIRELLGYSRIMIAETRGAGIEIGETGFRHDWGLVSLKGKHKSELRLKG